jgi:hypothetical protein
MFSGGAPPVRNKFPQAFTQPPFEEHAMQRTTSIPAVPDARFNLPGLPPELILQIALHIRDAHSLSSFARVGTQFANLSRAPAFVHALTDACIDQQCVALARLDIDDRPARIYQLACRTATNLRLPQLRKMLACLEPRMEGGPSDVNDAPGMKEASESSAMEVRCALVSAAILSGRIAGFDEEVRQHALLRVAEIPWQLKANIGWTIPVSAASDWHVALGIDALCRIWTSLANAGFDNPMAQFALAACLLRSAAPLPMSSKLRLLKAIVDSGIMEHGPIQKVFISQALEKFTAFHETLDILLAEDAFRLIGAVYGALIEGNIPLRHPHLAFAGMLPSHPWRENSQAGIDWLISVLRYAGAGLSAAQIRAAIPDGIFSKAEMAYLLESAAERNTSRAELEQIDPPAEAGQGGPPNT